MKHHYLIDYENVHEEGLTGLNTIEDDAVIHIFYSDRARKLDLDSFREGQILQIEALKVPVGKQSLDMQLVSYMGYLMGRERGEGNCYIIISKDNGYLNSIPFWRQIMRDGTTVEIRPQIRPVNRPQESDGSKSESVKTPVNPEGFAAEPSKAQTAGQNTSAPVRQEKNDRRTRGRGRGRNRRERSQETTAVIAEPEFSPEEISLASSSVIEEGKPTPAAVPFKEKSFKSEAVKAEPPVEEKPAVPAEEKPTAPVDVKSEALPAEKPAAPVDAKPEALPAEKPAAPVDVKPEALPAEKPAAPVDVKPEALPAEKPAVPVDVKPEALPAEKPALPVDVKSEALPAEKPSLPVDVKSEAPTAEKTAEPVVEKPEAPGKKLVRKSSRKSPKPLDRSALNTAVMQTLSKASIDAATTGKISSIVMKHVSEEGSKRMIYREIIRALGQKDGLVVYNYIKPLL